MSGAESVEIIGADRFARTMHAASSDIADMADSAAEAGRAVAAQGSSNAPRVTGRLAGSVHAESDGEGGALIGSGLIYAPVIHNGWPAHHITANPFLTRALDQRTNQVAEIYARGLDHALAQVKGA